MWTVRAGKVHGELGNREFTWHSNGRFSPSELQFCVAVRTYPIWHTIGSFGVSPKGSLSVSTRRAGVAVEVQEGVAHVCSRDVRRISPLRNSLVRWPSSHAAIAIVSIFL